MMNVLVTGAKGFLLRNTLPDYEWNIIEYNPNKDSWEGYHNIDLIIHFASPSDSYEFKNKRKMALTMIDYTQFIVDVALTNNCKMIFASSEAADYLDDEYGVYKKAMEQYIQAIVPNHLILRIPRVYGADRSKGLMRKIRNNDIDNWNKYVHYIDIEDFKIWFKETLSQNSIQYYTKPKRVNTITQIKEIYCV